MDDIRRLGAELTARLRALPDPAARVEQTNEALQQLQDLSTALAAVTRETVAGLRASGLTYAAIGALLGVSKTRAHQLAHRSAGPPPP